MDIAQVYKLNLEMEKVLAAIGVLFVLFVAGISTCGSLYSDKNRDVWRVLLVACLATMLYLLYFIADWKDRMFYGWMYP
jgi:Kef-type K+ transport system membrane component KefB